MKYIMMYPKHFVFGLLVGLVFVVMLTLLLDNSTMKAAQNTTACNSYYQRAAAASDGSQAQANLAAMATACYLKATR